MLNSPELKTQNQNRDRKAASAEQHSIKLDERGPPEETSVVKRRFKSPPHPLATSCPVAKSDSMNVADKAPSDYEPQQDSDSDRERRVDVKVWKKASQALQKRAVMTGKQSTLKELRFLDGDIELQQFPQHLLEALEWNCRKIRSKIPTCARGLSNESITTHDGREAFFAVKSTGEKLLQARFKYGSYKQVAIVRERVAKSINGGKAVIVTGISGFPRVFTDGSGSTYSEVKFQVWSPKNLTRHTQASDTDIVRLIKTANNDNPKADKFQSPDAKQPAINPIQQPLNHVVASKDKSLSPSIPDSTTAGSAQADAHMADDSGSDDSDKPLINTSQRVQTTKQPDSIASPKTPVPVLSKQRIPDQQIRQPRVNTIHAASPSSTEERSLYYSSGFSTPNRSYRERTCFTPVSTLSSQAASSTPPGGHQVQPLYSKQAWILQHCVTNLLKSATTFISLLLMQRSQV